MARDPDHVHQMATKWVVNGKNGKAYWGFGDHQDIIEEYKIGRPVVHAIYEPDRYATIDGKAWLRIVFPSRSERLDPQYFDILVDAIEEEYGADALRMDDKVIFGSVFNQTRVETFGEALVRLHEREPEGRSVQEYRPSMGIETYYPSGTPIYFGDRRPVHVRGHRRRA